MKREGREVRKEGREKGGEESRRKGRRVGFFMAAKHNTITDG